MSLEGAWGFRRSCMLFCHLFRLFDVFSRRKTSNTLLWDGRLHSEVVFPFHSPLNCGITVLGLGYTYSVSNSGRVCSCFVTVVEDRIFWCERFHLASSPWILFCPAAPEKVTEDWPATSSKETAAAWAVRLVPRLGLSMQGQVSFRPLVELLGKREAYIWFLRGLFTFGLSLECRVTRVSGVLPLWN